MAEHRIHTGSSFPIRQSPYRLAHAHRDMVENELEEMQRCDDISPSSSEWASPMVLVKKDGTLWLCVDYRRVNAASATDAYLLPCIDDIIDQIGRAKYLTTIDLTKGYWEVPVASEDRHKTAFCTPFRLFEFNVMPFGLQGAPGTFQRLMMDGLICGLSSFTSAYLDDLIIRSSTWEDHMSHLRIIFERIRNAGLTIKVHKCQFGMATCVYLGHVVGGGSLRPEQVKVEATRSMPVPQTKTQLRAFLGLAGYYRKLIPQYPLWHCR